MAARDLYVYVGRNAEGHRVWVQIRIDPSDDQPVTYTDHSTGPRPERVGISGVVLGSAKHPSEAADRYWISAGQIRDELDRIKELSAGMTDADLNALRRIWDSSHLNEMQAACDHMTPEMLTPPEGIPERYGRPDVTRWRIDNVVCPVTGYRWGTAWLAKKVEPADLDTLRRIQGKAR